MDWNIDFIKVEEFDKHVEDTIMKYGVLLQPFNIKKFNSNIIDPVKLIFDKSIYKASWEEIIKNEIFRQRDKSGNNAIGYFHQNLFMLISGCEVPKAGWDVIYRNANGVETPDGDVVHTIYVEMKNKHNTMNSTSAERTYIKMQNQLLNDDDCACYLVEVIASKSQNIKWKTKVENGVVQHKLIRRCSIDQFYAQVTGDQNAFFKICAQLPDSIERVLSRSQNIQIPKDTVLSELLNMAKLFPEEKPEIAISMAVYLLGFSSYNGFETYLPKELRSTNGNLNRLYEAANVYDEN